MDSPLDPTADLVAAHAASLRALARHLLADPHAADDAVQDAWVVALERPPRRDEGVGAWLRVVLRSVVSNQRRSAERRSDRERAVARPEAHESGDERARTARAVVDAVLALDDPYKRTVVARYFEGLMPREIAKRDAIPLHTVESRLQRALAQLRARLAVELDRRPGGTRRSLALLAAGDPVATTATGASVFGKLAAALVAFAAVAWFAWPRAPRPEPTDVASAPLVGDVETGGTRTPIGSRESAPMPVAGAATPIESQAALLALPPHEIRLVVRVTTPEGIPLDGAAVLLAPGDTALNDVAPTRGGGVANVRLRATTAEVDVLVAAWHPRIGRSGPWRLTVRAKRETRIDLALDDSAWPELGELATILRKSTDVRRTREQRGGPALLALLEAPASGVVDGRVQLGRIGLEFLAQSPWTWMSMGSGGDARTYTLERRAENERDTWAYTFAFDSPPNRASTARIAVRVVDDRGLAVAGALVVASAEVGGFVRRARADDQGECALEYLAPGDWRVAAAANGRGTATSLVHAAHGATSPWLARLDPVSVWTGELEPPRAASDRAMRVDWLAVGPERLSVRSSVADASGALRFAELPPDHAAIVAAPVGFALPSLATRDVAPTSPPIRIEPGTFASGTGGARVRVVDPDADTRDRFRWRHERLQVRLTTAWGVGVERCTWMDVDARVGGYRIEGLAPGRYVVDVGSELDGWVAPIALVVKADATTDLGDVALPPTGHVNAKRAPNARGARWLVRRGAAEIVLAVLDADGRSEFGSRVPPGEYLLFDPLDRARGIPFRVAADDVVTVDEVGVRQRARR